MEMKNLRDWYVHLLQDAYDAEKQITQALPKMAEAAKAAPLRKAFEQHLEQTRKQITMLEEIFQEMGEKAEGKPCKGMEGLIKEGEELIKEKGKIDDDVLDAALIAAAQKVEHYEIAGYGTAVSYAKLLGETKAARSLQKIADEEGATDKKLTTLAETRINKEAERQQAAKVKANGKKTTSKSSTKSKTSSSGSKAKSSSKSGSKSRTKASAK